MADEEHEDTWLYGSTNPEPPSDDAAAPSSTTDMPDSSGIQPNVSSNENEAVPDKTMVSECYPLHGHG